MNEIIFKYFQKLKKGEKISESSIPVSLSKNMDFINFCRVGIIHKYKSGKGFTYELNETKREIFEKYFSDTFPNSHIQAIDRISSIAKFKNSKTKQTQTIPIVFLKGYKNIKVNQHKVDLSKHTSNFGLFSTVLENIETEKICIVENKYLFLEIEKIISEDYVFIHLYGRIGKSFLEKLSVKKILVVSDYDYVGLNEYLKCKEFFVNTEFYIPEKYKILFEKYATELKNKNKKGQILSNFKRVLNSDNKIVVEIREQVKKTQKFLEQEILLYEC